VELCARPTESTIDVDATLIGGHSLKEGAAATSRAAAGVPRVRAQRVWLELALIACERLEPGAHTRE
jgi:hypothetical protein